MTIADKPREQEEEMQSWPPIEELVGTLDSLDEITQWLGTYRDRLRIARKGERLQLTEAVQRLEARHQRRRAELA